MTGSAPLTPGPSPLTPCVKVTDFGLARAFADAGSEMTGSGALLGTADYMAPEQAEDAHAADTRADVYALGCTLYFLLTGEAPFAGGSVHTKIARHATAPIPDPVAARPDVPGAVGAVVRRCMAKRPAARFQTPGELAAALRALAAPAPAAVRPKATPNPAVPAHDVSTVTLSTASDAPAPTVRKRRRVWPWAAVAALLLVVVVGVIVAPRGPNRDEGAKGDSRDAEPNKQNGPPKPAPKSPAKWPAWVTVSDPLPPDTPPPARVPLPRAKGTVPWAFDGSCWSARVDKVCAVGFLNDGSVVGGRDGEKKDGSDVGYWEVWPPTGGTPIRAGRPPTTEPYERPVLAHAVGLITDRFQRFDPLTFALMPLSRDVEKLDRDSAEGLDAAVVTPDGKYIAAVATPDGGNGRSERLILQWKAAGDAPPTGGRVTTGAKLTTVAVSADGHTMATLTVEGQVVVHTTQDTRKWFGPKPQKGKRHGEVALDPPGGRVYTAHDAEETIIVWDARTGQEVRRLPLAGWPYALTVSPDGRWLAAGGEAVSVWDLHATPPTRYELADHYAGHLWAVAFDDKSARLAVGGFGHRPPEGGEGVVWLWRKGP